MKSLIFDPEGNFNTNQFGANTLGLHNGINLRFKCVQFQQQPQYISDKRMSSAHLLYVTTFNSKMVYFYLTQLRKKKFISVQTDERTISPC